MKAKFDGRRNWTSDLAYIAGFVDGEGCIRIKQTPTSYYLIVHVTNSYLPVLKFIQERFGGNLRMQEKTKNKNIYNLHLSCGVARDFLKSIIGFLIEKKPQAELGLKFADLLPVSTKAERNLMYLEMRRLKKVNIHENPELLKEGRE